MLDNLKEISMETSKLLKSPSFLIALILLSFEFKLSNNERWAFLLFLLSFVWFKNARFKFHINWPLGAYFSFVASILYILFYVRPARAIQFLSYGYDNALHFTLFRGISETTWYPNVDLANWFTDFQLFTNVPLGYYSLTSFLLHPFTLVVTDSISLASCYAIYQVFSAFILMWLVFLTIRNPAQKNVQSRIFYAAMSSLIVVCLGSTLLVNGFPPYFFSLIIILIWLNFDSKNPVRWQKNLTLSLCIYSASMLTPAPAIFLFLPASILIFQELMIFRKNSSVTELMLNLLPFAGIGALVLWSFADSSAGLGWRQLLQSGGLQNINLITSSLILTFTTWILSRNRQKILNDSLALLLISGLLSVVVLSSLTVAFTGNLQYYAIKQIYVLLFFASIYLVQNLDPLRIKIPAAGILGLLLLIPVLNPIFFTGGFMGVAPRVLAHTLNPEYWEREPVNAELIMNIKGLKNDKTNSCYIWRGKDGFTDLDLSSRWINSLKSTNLISEKCFTSYWNNGGLSDLDLEKKLQGINNDFVILTESDNSLKNKNKIQYKIISPKK